MDKWVYSAKKVNFAVTIVKPLGPGQSDDTDRLHNFATYGNSALVL